MNCNCRNCAMAGDTNGNGECCFDGMGGSTDPMTVEGTVAAGCVCSDGAYSNGCMLAAVYFPNQEYRAGFTPENALCAGTMFPELVRLYK